MSSEKITISLPVSGKNQSGSVVQKPSSAGFTTWKISHWEDPDAPSQRKFVQLELADCKYDDKMRPPLYCEFTIGAGSKALIQHRAAGMFHIGEKSGVYNVCVLTSKLAFIEIRISVYYSGNELWLKRQMCLPIVEIPEQEIVDHVALFLDQNKYSDVKIVVDDQVIQAHKMILSQSPVFFKMMEETVVENPSDILQLKLEGIEYDVVVEVLRFLYTGKPADLFNFYDLAEPLLIAANKLDIANLKRHCEEHLLRILNIENACHMMIIGSNCYAINLRLGAKTFILFNFREVEATNGFKKLREEDPYILKEIMGALSDRRQFLKSQGK